MPDLTRSTISFASIVSDESSQHVSGEQIEDVNSRPADPPRLQDSVSLSDGDVYNQPSNSRGSRSERTNLLDSSKSYRKYADSRTISPRSTRTFRRANTSIYSLGRSQSNNQSSPTLGRRVGLRTPKAPKTPKFRTSLSGSALKEDIIWYDQFTSTDWVRDSIADGHRVLELRKQKGIRGRLHLIYDAAQGWFLIAIIGALIAACAYLVDVSEAVLYDWKLGFCTTSWFSNKSNCCRGRHECGAWTNWSQVVGRTGETGWWLEWLTFTIGCMSFAALACLLTLRTENSLAGHIATNMDENLAKELSSNPIRRTYDDVSSESLVNSPPLAVAVPPPITYYPAAGSGVAEVKIILSGFVLHGYLGVRTFLYKTIALIPSVASGMSLGKEGPYVHIATCIGNVVCRFFPKYHSNDAKRREILSASAASGVAVAFGSPLGGVLFSLEEVSYYFPPKTLFRTFSCCIVAALCLKFWNPYGNNKTVLFEVRYTSDWGWFELLCFSAVGVLGGLIGALFIKASRFWATTFRRIPTIKQHPMLEVLLVALVTGLTSYWNRYTNLAVAELLLELASPCAMKNRTGLCPSSIDDIPGIIRYLALAFLVKAFLTVITFGIKVPAGIYVPSMVVGGILGRIVGHTLQYIALSSHSSWFFGHCPATGNLEDCITPGVYALVAAGATMCGVTRLSVTLAVILFELTGSLDHVLPFSLGILFAKVTADFIEPRSIYDLLIDMNSYPYIDNRTSPVFESELGEITPWPKSNRMVDISISPLVRASELRSKLVVLQNVGELDGGLPIIRDKILVGLLPVPDLEYALDRLPGLEEKTLCLLSDTRHAPVKHRGLWMGLDESVSFDADNGLDQSLRDSAHIEPLEHFDLTPFIDPAPVALEVHSPMNLVYQCFVKLGLRHICVVENGEYRGMVHKRLFVKYVKNHELELNGC